MEGFVGAAAIEVGKCFVEPIKRQFSYLCCFNANMQNLENEATKLGDAKVGVERQVEAARRNAEVILPEVEIWLNNVNNVQAQRTYFDTAILNVKSHCLAIKPRFLISREATWMAAAMKELQDNHSMFGQISHPPLPAAMAPVHFPAAMASIPLRPTKVSVPLAPAAMVSVPHPQAVVASVWTSELESRKIFEDHIMATLREKNVGMMGICGMGGIGKTTMAKKIMSRARGEGLFDEIVMVVVSQPVDMLRIQKEMAELLGLKLEVESVPARAHLLCARLMNTKSILIILDDIWKELNLEQLGIPDQRELKESTILLTSRDTDVFSAMNVEMTFHMKTLEDVEAWSLFKEKVGASADDQTLFPTAQEIVQECRGLPIALVTVGVALRYKTQKYIWKDALHELRSCNPQDIPDFLAQVYNPLKLSYDLLESEHARSIFLLCCLFPEDRYILISDLGLYAWGLGIFEGLRSLQVTRNKVQTLVEMLKSRSLLLDDNDDRFTKIHDVVRDVGIFIAAEKGLIDPNLNWKSWPREESKYSNNCTWISLFDAGKITLPKGSVFPNLRFLLVEGPRLGPTEMELPLCEEFFESARELDVLSMGSYFMRSLPHTIQLLKNLRTLILCFCESLENISVVGELVSLEILYCHHCPSVKELPIEIGRLNQLKLLDISNCESLETIAAGVISKLIILEELTLIGSFKGWELGLEEGKNAGLCELSFLSSLTTLRIEIDNASLAAEQICLSTNLVEFNITFGYPIMRTSYGSDMQLVLERDVILGDWIQKLLRSTKSLAVCGEDSSKLVPLLPEFQDLKELIFLNAKTRRLSDRRSNGTNTVFPILESLILQDIDDLEEIHNGPISSNSFNNLQRITLANLSSLQQLWNVVPLCNISSTSITECAFLSRLKSLTIQSCSMLEEAVMWDEEENGQSSRITFQNLVNLILDDLPRLTTLCKGIDRIDFPALTQMKITKCPNLKSLVSSTENDHKKCLDDDSLHFFCKPDQAAFGKLEQLAIDRHDCISNERSVSLWCDQIYMDFFTGLVDLTVSSCGNIKSIFSLSIATNLVNLRKLSIESCHETVKVIEDGEVERSPIFIKLEVLRLEKLPKLKAFCEWRCALQLSSLRRVDISECPEMARFSFGSLTTPNLNYISMNTEVISDYTKDLNDALVGGDFLHLDILFGSDE